MSALSYVHRVVIPAAYSLLPAKMRSEESKPMLLAIGLQESRFEHRFQIRGPARGFWQSEETGGAWNGVLNHHLTQEIARQILMDMAYGQPDVEDFRGVAHNDILACCLARLLLWTHPHPLPHRFEVDRAWDYYNDVWRPGLPHPETWPWAWEAAWTTGSS